MALVVKIVEEEVARADPVVPILSYSNKEFLNGNLIYNSLFELEISFNSINSIFNSNI